MANIALAVFLLLFAFMTLVETALPKWVLGLVAGIVGLIWLAPAAWWKRTP